MCQASTVRALGSRAATAVLGLIVLGCGDGSDPDAAVLKVVVEDHSIGYIEGSVGILQLVDGPADEEIGVRAVAQPDQQVEPGVWAGTFEPLELVPGDYVVRVWMLACEAAGCGDDLDEHMEAARRSAPNLDFGCEGEVSLRRGQSVPLVAAIGPDGCIGMSPDPPPETDRPALTSTVGDGVDAAPSIEIGREQRRLLTAIALAMDGLPSHALVSGFEPAFNETGELTGAVVQVLHADFTGTIDLPALDLMEAGGQEIAVPTVVRYTVEAARRMDIAIDLDTRTVLWATPAPTFVTDTELVSRSDVDVEGRPVPADARQLEGE